MADKIIMMLDVIKPPKHDMDMQRNKQTGLLCITNPEGVRSTVYAFPCSEIRPFSFLFIYVYMYMFIYVRVCVCVCGTTFKSSSSSSSLFKVNKNSFFFFYSFHHIT